jgi:VanZ family protein
MVGNKTEKPFSVLFRVASISCIIALAILSWLPANELARTSLGGHVEHFIAYLGTATAMGLAFQRRPQLAMQCALLVAYAAVLEVGQLYSPGRHASVEDFAFGAAGAVSGGLLMWIVRSCMLTLARGK